MICGLVGAEFATGVMTLITDVPGENVDFLRASALKDALPSQGVWDDAKNELKVHVRFRLEAGHLLRFCFTVNNQRTADD